MKKQVILFLLLASTPLWSEAKVELQFYNQTYRLNSPIPVVVNVFNQEGERMTFQVSPQIYESFYFLVKTPKNEDIVIKDDFRIEMKENASSAGDYRDITLDAGESFSRTIDITQWFDIRESGYYFIKGVFYPNPDDRSLKIESSFYKILVKAPAIVEETLADEKQKQINHLQEMKKLPPYDAIADLIDAKMKKDWDRFLAHIDASRLIDSFQNFSSDYQNARTGAYRLEVLERFKRYLTVHWQDMILEYKIKKSEIEDDKATVEADIEYKIRTVSYALRYTFYLYKNHENQWLIYDYTALRIK